MWEEPRGGLVPEILAIGPIGWHSGIRRMVFCFSVQRLEWENVNPDSRLSSIPSLPPSTPLAKGNRSDPSAPIGGMAKCSPQPIQHRPYPLRRFGAELRSEKRISRQRNPADKEMACHSRDNHPNSF